MINTTVVKSSSIQGLGVYANQALDAGNVILEIDDSHIVTDESLLTEQQQQFDCDYLANGKIILMQEPEKFINHSCEPTSYAKTFDGVRQVLAIKNIRVGEEITFDYAINGDNEGTFICSCDAPNCRKVYNGNFFKLPIETQHKYLPYLDDWFVAEHVKEVEQLRKEK